MPQPPLKKCKDSAFCWSHQSQQGVAACAPAGEDPGGLPRVAAAGAPDPAEAAGRGEDQCRAASVRPLQCWPVALRAVRAWLEPWIMLWRYWRGWSSAPPPSALGVLLDRLWQGHGISLYVRP